MHRVKKRIDIFTELCYTSSNLRMVIVRISQTYMYKYFLKRYLGRIYAYRFFYYLETVAGQRGNRL